MNRISMFEERLKTKLGELISENTASNVNIIRSSSEWDFEQIKSNISNIEKNNILINSIIDLISDINLLNNKMKDIEKKVDFISPNTSLGGLVYIGCDFDENVNIDDNSIENYITELDVDNDILLLETQSHDNKDIHIFEDGARIIITYKDTHNIIISVLKNNKLLYHSTRLHDIDVYNDLNNKYKISKLVISR
ncbi:MAG: hypothetical protein ACRCXT_18615 [Paraclostridium sp.]